MRRFALPLVFVSGVVLTIAVLVLLPRVNSVLSSHQQNFEEVKELTGTTWTFQEYSDYFRKLSEDKGAEYAFKVLRVAPFPPGIDLHLLAHVVGEMLYKQKGIAAIAICTDDFRNACSHTVVIGILLEHGEGSLPEIAETCKKAPGGKGAYNLCFHGLGHGVLAYTGYDFEKSIEMCKKVGTKEHNDREYIECVGGSSMEMMAGVHDRQAWEAQKGKYFKEDDPLAPCDASFMPREAQPICYIHLTPHLFQAVGADLRNPTPKNFKDAFAYCNALSEDDDLLRNACYGGFGKEFIVIARGKDVRDIGASRTDELQKTVDWCALANDTLGEKACQSSALASLFWGGENTPDASFGFCALTTGEFQTACYTQLAGQVQFYSTDPAKKADLCKRLPEQYQTQCNR